MIDVNKIEVGSKLRICDILGRPRVIKVVYLRLSVVFFVYEDGTEDWLPIGSFVIERAEFV